MVALLIMNLIKLYRQRIINIFIMALIHIQVKKTGANSSTYNTNTYIQIPFRTPNNQRLREHLPPLQSKARGPPSLTCWPEGRGHDYVGVFGGALRKDGSTAATLAVRKACMQKRRFWRLVAHSNSCKREREKKGKNRVFNVYQRDGNPCRGKSSIINGDALMATPAALNLLYYV